MKARLLKFTLSIISLMLVAQGCEKDPIPTTNSQISVKETRQPYRVEPGCQEIWNVYYNTLTGAVVSEEYQYTDCSGSGSGGINDSGSGASGSGSHGGSIGTLAPNVILAAPPTNQIANISDHLKCYDRTQGATFSVYAAQPRPGTRQTWSGNMLSPNVGHTFVSITQGGITRVMGFYPALGISPLNPSGPSVLSDDSDHDYSVRINFTLTPSQLANLLAYISAYPGAYDLNNYNCTDFGIGASGAAGFPLPATDGSWGPGPNHGRNPGGLGQDMRLMPLPSGASRDLQGGQADSFNGGC